MAEAKTGAEAGDLADEASAQHLVDGRRERFFVEPTGRTKDRDVELRTDHGRDAEEVVRCVGEPPDAPTDNLADALRYCEIVDGVPNRPAAILLKDGAALDQVPENLFHEERVSVGLVEDPGGEGELLLADQRPSRGLRQQCHGVGVGEPPDRHVHEPGRPVEIGDRLGERVPTVHLRVPVRRQHQRARRLRMMGDMTQHQKSRPRRPLQVVEDQEHRGVLGRCGQPEGNRVEEPVSLGFGVRAERFG